jgi:hypothetical protein
VAKRDTDALWIAKLGRRSDGIRRHRAEAARIHTKPDDHGLQGTGLTTGTEQAADEPAANQMPLCLHDVPPPRRRLFQPIARRGLRPASRQVITGSREGVP